MQVPLIAAIVRKKIVDYAIKSSPICSVIRVCCLCARDSDMRIAIAFNHSVTRHLICASESDLHEGAMVCPGREVPGLLRFGGCVGNNIVPTQEAAFPLAIQRVKRAVFLF